jgi:hypothetical protein
MLTYAAIVSIVLIAFFAGVVCGAAITEYIEKAWRRINKHGKPDYGRLSGTKE